MTQTAVAHAHHYRLASPDGRERVPGVCACGDVREFAAAWQFAESGWPMVINYADAEARRIASQDYRVYEKRRK